MLSESNTIFDCQNTDNERIFYGSYENYDENSNAKIAIDAFGCPVIVVDRKLHVLFSNQTGIHFASLPGSDISFVRDRRTGRRLLSFRRQREATTLRGLVGDAIDNGVEGVLKLTLSHRQQQDSKQFAFLVSPAGTEALIVIRNMQACRTVSPALLSRLFSLSPAEGEVASCLMGGVTADSVARARGVRLDTIRAQIRSILAKSESENLRCFENKVGAILAIMPGVFAQAGPTVRLHDVSSGRHSAHSRSHS
jgi:DNA-binding CsgD family transcriptional regulator